MKVKKSAEIGNNVKDEESKNYEESKQANTTPNSDRSTRQTLKSVDPLLQFPSVVMDNILNKWQNNQSSSRFSGKTSHRCLRSKKAIIRRTNQNNPFQ